MHWVESEVGSNWIICRPVLQSYYICQEIENGSPFFAFFYTHFRVELRCLLVRVNFVSFPNLCVFYTECLIHFLFRPLSLSSAGLSTLRLVKVEIPAYKFRGESALLECVYELNVGGGGGGIGQLVVGGSSSSRTRGRDNLGGGGQYYAARYRQPLEYISNHEESGDEDGGVVEEEFKYAKRKRKKYARYRKFDEDGDGDAEDEDEAEAEDGGEEDQEMEAGEAGEEFEENTHHRNDNNNNNHNGDFGGDVSHFPSSSSSFPSSSSMANGGGFPETLYSVKWYKDNEEFYRYVPKANPPQNSYKVEGIRVDVSGLLCLMLHAGSVSCYRHSLKHPPTHPLAGSPTPICRLVICRLVLP